MLFRSITELLVSPVSWSHHWDWVAPILVCALIKGWRLRPTQGWSYFAIACAVTAVFISEPQVWFPHANGLEEGWAFWEQIIGSSYVWVGLATLCIFAFRRTRPVAEPLDPKQGPAVESLPRADQPEADPRDEAAMERLTNEASASAGARRGEDES